MVKLYLKYHLGMIVVFIMISILTDNEWFVNLIFLMGYVMAILWHYLVYKDLERKKENE